MKMPMRLTLADYQRSRYFVAVDPGTPFSVVTGTEYWANVAKALKPMDVVEVVALDGAFDAELRLLSKTPARLEWRVLRKTDGEARPIVADTESAFRVVHKGRGSWAVQDRQTGDFLADGLDKVAAEQEAAKLDAERRAA